MDHQNDRGHSWDWQRKNSNHHEKQSDFSCVSDMYSEVTLNQEDHSYLFDEEATPVKACGDLAYRISCDNANKEPEEQRETRSVLKRRRLQFDNQVSDSSVCSGEKSSAILNANGREDPFDEILPDESQLIRGFSDDASTFSFEGLDLSASEEWISDCFNNADMQFIPENMDCNYASDIQIDVSEFLNLPPETEANMVQQHVTRASPNVVFKGRKSFVPMPSKLPSSIVYPFTFIKPCGVQGDITLKDINQRIQIPPSKPEQIKEDECRVYQTSAFSGKPVVGKTKIHTEGGKGSITIMRTKG